MENLTDREIVFAGGLLAIAVLLTPVAAFGFGWPWASACGPRRGTVGSLECETGEESRIGAEHRNASREACRQFWASARSSNSCGTLTRRPSARTACVTHSSLLGNASR